MNALNVSFKIYLSHLHGFRMRIFPGAAANVDLGRTQGLLGMWIDMRDLQISTHTSMSKLPGRVLLSS